MIPVRDVIPSRRAPMVTIALILVELVAHASGLLRGAAFDAWLARPAGADRLSPARLVLALFDHDGWPALAVSLLYLWVFGENVEDRLGRARFGLLFVACGLASGAAGSALSSGWTPPAGAAGAIAGVLGAYAALFPKSRVLMLVPLPGLFDLVEAPAVHLMLVWLLAQLFFSFGAPERVLVVNGTGFLAGAALVVLLGGRRRRDRYWAEQ